MRRASAIYTGKLHGSQYRLVLLTTLFPSLGVRDIPDDLLCRPLPVLQFSTNERRRPLASRIVDTFLWCMKTWVVVLRHCWLFFVWGRSSVRGHLYGASGMTQPHDANGRLGFVTLIWLRRSNIIGIIGGIE